jgi:hypothetical protein
VAIGLVAQRLVEYDGVQWLFLPPPEEKADDFTLGFGVAMEEEIVEFSQQTLAGVADSGL